MIKFIVNDCLKKVQKLKDVPEGNIFTFDIGQDKNIFYFMCYSLVWGRKVYLNMYDGTLHEINIDREDADVTLYDAEIKVKEK